jgi:beta-glucosidase
MAMTLALVGACAMATSAQAAPCPSTGAHPWCDKSQSPDQRAAALVKAMTLSEKITLLAGDLSADGHTGATAAVARLGVPKSYNTDGPVGVRQGKATALPTPMAEAATFDPEMARLHGTTVGTEARAKGNDGVLAPTVNIMRTPQGGRTFEAFGEDPFLVGRMAVAWIEGAQAQGVYATVKHFAANNQEGSDPTGLLSSAMLPIGAGVDNVRYLQNSVVDERTLREIYLPQFEAAVKEAHVGSVMCSYNRLNGDWTCANKHLLSDILINEWGFKGIVMSDWLFATHAFDTVKHLTNGLDLEMPFADAYLAPLVQAVVSSGLVKESVIDTHVERLMRTLFAFGFFDRDAYRNDDAQIDRAKNGAASQKIEESALTLLRNRDNLLPLDASKVKSLAVIGPYATKFVTGGGSGNVTPPASVTALQGIKDRLGSGVQVNYDDGSNPARAAAAAKAADAAVVVVGDYQTEGADKSCLTLECPNVGVDQDALINAVAAAQSKSIVVLETGGPVLTPWRETIGALLEAWYPGDHGGTAIARVLFGDIDPAGRLPATFPASADQEQVAGNREKYPGTLTQDTLYTEGVFVGYRWFDAHGFDPAYPFGAGLSYASFGFGGLTVAPAADGSTAATATISAINTAKRTGSVVPQLYLAVPHASPDVSQPPLKLAGFAKQSLAPGAKKSFSFDISTRALSYWDVKTHDWAVAPGCYGVAIGTSSRDIVRRVTVAVGGANCPGAVATLPGKVAAKACSSRRVVTVRRLGVARKQVKRVELYVNGKRRRTLQGPRASLKVTLTGLPRGTARVTIVVRRTHGAAKRIKRLYHLCGG